MDLEPKAVPQAVHEVLAVPRVGDDLSGDRIHVAARDAGTEGRRRLAVRPQQDVVQLEGPRLGMAHGEVAGDVRHVAVHRHAVIERHGVPALEGPARRPRMAHGSPLPRGHDEVVMDPALLPAQPLDLGEHPALELHLRHPGPHLLQDGIVGLARDDRGPAYGVGLRPVLGAAQRENEGRAVHPTGGKRLEDRLEEGMRHLLRLEGDRAPPLLRHRPGDVGRQGQLRLDGQGEGRLLRGLGPVTPVRDQARVLPVDEQGSGAAAEARDVMAALRVEPLQDHEDEGVHPLLAHQGPQSGQPPVYDVEVRILFLGHIPSTPF